MRYFNINVSFIKLTIFLFAMSSIIFTSGAFASNNGSNWFNSLQKAIEASKTGKTLGNEPELEEVVAQAIDSGAQMYVIIQTAMAMDSSMAGKIIEATIQVTKKPGQVIKAAIIANINIDIIVKAAIQSGVTADQIVLAAIAAGADLDILISECIKAGADPADTIMAAISATKNVGAVVDAAVKAGAPEKDIAKAVFSDNTLVDETQAVTSCIKSGIDLNTVIREALDAGVSNGLVVIVSLYTSNNYQQVVNSALTWGVSKDEIQAYARDNLSIDQEALKQALEASETITAYTPAERRSPPRNSINTEPGRGSVSPN